MTKGRSSSSRRGPQQRRPRTSARRKGGGGGGGGSSTGRKDQSTPSSASQGGGEGRTFSVKTTKNPSTLVSEAKRVAKENDATLRGDTNSGSFSGKGVKGRYTLDGKTVQVTITEKPTLASWSTVESKVKEFFR